MPKQEKLDKMYMAVAKEVSTLSYCKRKKVGCVIVRGNNILSMGYNGTPSGFDNNCEDHVNGDKTNWWVLHAEANAIVKMVRVTGESTEGATLYTTCSPCKECAKLIIQAGIKKILYRDVYRDEPQFAYEALDLLKQADIHVVGRLKY